MGGGEQRFNLVVHHLFVGVVLCEHAKELDDAGVLHTMLQLSRRSQKIETKHTSASNLIVKDHRHSQRQHNDKIRETHWSPVPSKHNTNVRAAFSGGMTMGATEIEPSLTAPGLVNADTWGELEVSVAVSDRVLAARKWPSSAVVDIYRFWCVLWEKKGGEWWA
jgi:hypothetical protein